MKNNIQQKKYSHTPKIKIKKWREKVCIACVHNSKDFGEYDTVGWHVCNENRRIGKLKRFPNCSAKHCDKFNPRRTVTRESDYWLMIMDFEKAFGRSGYKQLHKLLEFNERIGDYKVGRIL